MLLLTLAERNGPCHWSSHANLLMFRNSITRICAHWMVVELDVRYVGIQIAFKLASSLVILLIIRRNRLHGSMNANRDHLFPK